MSNLHNKFKTPLIVVIPTSVCGKKIRSLFIIYGDAVSEIGLHDNRFVWRSINIYTSASDTRYSFLLQSRDCFITLIKRVLLLSYITTVALSSIAFVVNELPARDVDVRSASRYANEQRL